MRLPSVVGLAAYSLRSRQVPRLKKLLGPARLFLRAEPSQHLALERSVFREYERTGKVLGLDADAAIKNTAGQ